MKNRHTLVIAVTALVVAVFGSTPLGTAAGGVVKRALFASNAGKVNGIKASKKPKAGRLLALGKNRQFPVSVSGTGAAVAGSLASPPASPSATVEQATIKATGNAHLAVFGRAEGASYPCTPSNSPCTVTWGLYVDDTPVEQTALGGFPFCAIPPCTAFVSAGTVLGVVAVKAGTHVVAMKSKVTSGAVTPSSTPPKAQVGAIAVG